MLIKHFSLFFDKQTPALRVYYSRPGTRVLTHSQTSAVAAAESEGHHVGVRHVRRADCGPVHQVATPLPLKRVSRVLARPCASTARTKANARPELQLAVAALARILSRQQGGARGCRQAGRQAGGAGRQAGQAGGAGTWMFLGLIGRLTLVTLQTVPLHRERGDWYAPAGGAASWDSPAPGWPPTQNTEPAGLLQNCSSVMPPARWLRLFAHQAVTSAPSLTRLHE